MDCHCRLPIFIILLFFFVIFILLFLLLFTYYFSLFRHLRLLIFDFHAAFTLPLSCHDIDYVIFAVFMGYFIRYVATAQHCALFSSPLFAIVIFATLELRFMSLIRRHCFLFRCFSPFFFSLSLTLRVIFSFSLRYEPHSIRH